MTDPAARLRRVGRRAVAVAFGDRGGVVVFLAAALFLGALWRVGIFIEDSTTLANAVANVAEGRIAVVDVPYSLTAGGQPGLVEADGRLFARNYGHVYLAVVVYWVLAAATEAVALSLLLLGVWCLGLVALSRSASRLFGRPRLETGGSALALVVLIGSLPTLTAFPPDRGYLVALQLATILVTAAAGTFAYRLLAYFHGRRAGLVAGGLTVVATPLGFWGSLPKRHALTAALVLAAVYCFAISRTRSRPAVRAAGYAAIGLLSAVHAFEAAFLLIAYAPVEVLSAPRNDRRTLAVVGVVFLLSTAPMLATNAAISGNPLEPPRLLPGTDKGGFPAPSGGAGGSGAVAVDGSADGRPPNESGARPDGSEGAGGGGGQSDGGAETPSTAAPGGDRTGERGGSRIPEILAGWLGSLSALAGRVGSVAALMVDEAVAGLAAATEPDRLFYTFVRGGWNPFVHYNVTEFEAVDLALLEVLPVAGALAALPVALAGRLRDGIAAAVASLRAGLASPVRQTDLLVGTVALTFLLVYLSRLPLQSQITVRYLVPVGPLVVYGVVRLPALRRALVAVPRVLAVGYLVTAVGTVLALSLAVFGLDLAVGEAMQLQALVGLATAGLAALAVASWPGHRDARAVAIGVAVPAGVTTAFLVLSALSYFRYGRYALEFVRLVAEHVPAA